MKESTPSPSVQPTQPADLVVEVTHSGTPTNPITSSSDLAVPAVDATASQPINSTTPTADKAFDSPAFLPPSITLPESKKTTEGCDDDIQMEAVEPTSKGEENPSTTLKCKRSETTSQLLSNNGMSVNFPIYSLNQ